MNRPRDPVLVLVDPSIGRTGAFVCAQNMAVALTGQIPTFLVVPTSAKFNPDDISPFVGLQRLPLRAQSRFLPASVCWLLGLLPSGLRLRFFLFETRATHLVLNDFYLLQGFICRLLGFRGQIITWVRVEPRRAGGRLTGLLWVLILLSSSRVVSVSRFVKNK